MLIKDSVGLDITAPSQEAVSAHDDLVVCVLSHSRAAPQMMARLFEADPQSVMGWAIKCFSALMLARSELAGPARAAALEARKSFAERGGTRREGYYVRAAMLASHGQWTRALELIELVVSETPEDSLAAKLSHGLRFMIGDSKGMRRSIESVVSRIGSDHPYLGYMYGCQSFVLEEAGEYVAAERVGRKAMMLAPQDAWGLHAVSHVYEMTGNAAAGIQWLETRKASYAHCNNFSYHLFWHLALYRLELGDTAGVLDLYDEQIRNVESDDFRDIANAASLLTRLELDGVNVGRRWDEIADIAERRVADGSLVFADLHYLLALIGAGRDQAAHLLSAHLGTDGERSVEQGRVAAAVGAGMSDALLAFKNMQFGEAAETMTRLRPDLLRIGGSHAQRDVFEQIRLEAVIRSGQLDQAEDMLLDRLAARGGSNAFAAKRLARLKRSGTRNERVGVLATALMAPQTL
ncbi:MAG: tetratricopeptide repeat protein [Beijerinckiaceae bacterium]|nr:tetratricopeptide repeat protein [Beijerinckiaceae bacterium]